MHPGPVNRGVELSGEVIDSPQSLITEQVASGLVVRMAILYELLARRRAAGARSAGERRRATDPDRTAGVSLAEAARHALRRGRGPGPARRDGARPGRRDRRRPRRRHPRRRDRRARRARLGRRRRRRGGRGRGPARLPGLLRPPRPPAHARARSTRRTSRPAPAPPPPAATAGCSRWPTPSRRSPPPADIEALREAARARGLGPGRLPRHRHPRHGGRGADRDGGAARGRRGRLQRRRPADPQRPHPAPRAPVPAPLRRHDRPARGGPRALRRRRHARGPGLGGARPGRHPLGLRVDDDRPRRRARRLRGRPDPRPAPLRGRVGRGGARRQGGRGADQLRGDARTTSASPTRRCAASTRAASR